MIVEGLAAPPCGVSKGGTMVLPECVGCWELNDIFFIFNNLKVLS